MVLELLSKGMDSESDRLGTDNPQLDIVAVIGGIAGILLGLGIQLRAYRRGGIRGSLKTTALANAIVIPAYAAFRWWSQ